MTNNRSRFTNSVGLAILLGALSTFGTLMAGDTQTNEYTATVLRLGGTAKWDKGRLEFTGEEVLFESSSGKEHEEWGYNRLKRIDVAEPRLLKLTLLSGERVEFTPFGGETFGSALVQFLDNHVKAPVQIKSEL